MLGMPVKKYSDEQVKEAVANSESFSGVLRYLGAGPSGSVHGHFKRRIKQMGIDYSHFKHRTPVANAKKALPIEEILVIRPPDSSRQTRYNLVRAMKESGMRYECDELRHLRVARKAANT